MCDMRNICLNCEHAKEYESDLMCEINADFVNPEGCCENFLI